MNMRSSLYNAFFFSLLLRSKVWAEPKRKRLHAASQPKRYQPMTLRVLNPLATILFLVCISNRSRSIYELMFVLYSSFATPTISDSSTVWGSACWTPGWSPTTQLPLPPTATRLRHSPMGRAQCSFGHPAVFFSWSKKSFHIVVHQKGPKLKDCSVSFLLRVIKIIDLPILLVRVILQRWKWWL